MARRIAALCVVMMVLAAAAPAAWADVYDDCLGAYSPAIRAGLAQKNLRPEDVRFDLHDRAVFGGDRYRLPFLDLLLDNPWKIPHYVPTVRDGVLKAAREAAVAGLCQQAQARLNLAVRVGLIGDPLEHYQALLADESVANHLVAAVKKLYAARKLPWDANEEAYLAGKSAELPEAVADAAAIYLYALPDILAYRDAALAPVKARLQQDCPDDPVAHFISYLLEEEEQTGPEQIAHSAANDQLAEYLLDNLDWGYLYTGAMVLAHVLDYMHSALKEQALEERDFSFAFDTPLGMIVLNGSADDSCSGALPYLLIIDTGGNDSYTGGGATVDLASPCSVLFDLRGNDSYQCTQGNAPSFGCGVFGYGFLIDCAGDDLYSALHYSQGAGVFGVGMLLEDAGTDHYSVVTGGQGSGTCGTGILADLSGGDVYECYQLSQGFGFTLGTGLLVDLVGDDRYAANDEDIRFPSSQSAEHNSSLSQGFGFGARRDYTTGHSWAGGVGMLIDGAGDDAYSCGVFGQGAGYWYGVGILADGSGDDNYHGHWYVQASGAHFALGILDEASGDDHYFADLNMAQGAGHDFSLGFLVERAGTDTYAAPNLSLGGGNASGIGIFWDFGGNDTYNVSAATTLGRANNGARGGLRDFMRVLGLFIDTGGKDAYPAAYAFAGDNLMWTQAGTDEEQPLPLVELGVGVDAEVVARPPS